MGRVRGLAIGTVARRTGCAVSTVRYYESIGLIASAERNDGGQRRYGPGALRQLTFIRRCRDLGMPVGRVRALLAMLESPDRPCDDVLVLAQEQLAALRGRTAELRALEATLMELMARCSATCAGGPTSRCTLVNDLSEVGPIAGQAALCCPGVDGW